MSEVRCEEKDSGPSLTNGLLTVEVLINSGAFSIRSTTPGLPAITGASASVITADGSAFSTRGESLEFAGATEVSDVHGDGLSMLLTREADDAEPELHVLITVYKTAPFTTIKVEVRNTEASPIRVQELRPLDGAVLEIATGQLRFYKHGWQSWSPTAVLDCSGADLTTAPPVVGPGTQPSAGDGRFVSEQIAAIADAETNHGIVCGFISAADQLSHVSFERDPTAITAISYADGVEVRRRELISSETLYIELTDSPVQALERFGDALAAEMDAIHRPGVTSGWCSWYYYWQGITESEMIANLDHTSANHDSLPFEYVQLDDGYQAEIGDWLTPNETFPSGMKWLADQIHDHGYKAGIWLAPFIAGERSALYAEHPDWFVQSPDGGLELAIKNWGQDCYALDLTRPDVIDWLRRTFATICDGWGYDYVKIDFIYAGAIDGVRHDPNVTRAQAYRRGLETIRETVGDRFILACGNPQGASVGLVDGARVGPDVAPYWKPFDRRQPGSGFSDPAAINSIRNSVNRYWMHNRLWANDPDCLLVRDTDIALSGDEVRTLASVIFMTGGMVLSSDNLRKLTPERQRIISQLLPIYGKAATPIDLFHAADVPKILDLDCGTYRILALFNWDDGEALVPAQLPKGDWHAFEFWQTEYLGIVSGRIEVPAPGRGCRLIRLTPVKNHPQVVGSTLHIAQGALEIADETWDGDSLSVALKPVACADGSIFAVGDGEVREIPVAGLLEPCTIRI